MPVEPGLSSVVTATITLSGNYRTGHVRHSVSIAHVVDVAAVLELEWVMGDQDWAA